MRKTSYIKITLLLLLIPMATCFSQKQSIVSKTRILTYGLPNFGKENAKNVIADKWGIEFYTVAGCVVTKKLVDSIEKKNEISERSIEKKHGKNWQDKFYKEVNIEFQTENKVTAIIDKLNYITIREKALEKEGNGLNYLMTPIPNTTKYNVAIKAWGKFNKTDALLTYYKLIVDYKTKVVAVLSDKIVAE